MPHQVVQNTRVDGFQIFVDIRSSFSRVGVGFRILLHGEFVPDIPDRRKGNTTHIAKLVALAVVLLYYIGDV